MESAVLRVLSIDGAGIRGIIPATVLAALEQITDRRTADLFDYVAGTSTGGILALALMCPQPSGHPNTAAEIRDLYLTHGPEIFPLGGEPLFRWSKRRERGRTPLPSSVGLRKMFAWGGGDAIQGNARYPASPLEGLLARQFGGTLMSAAMLPIAILSCDLDTGSPLVFRGGGLDQGDLGDPAMCLVGRATSAGPTFFQPLLYKDHRCADGGLIVNDPAFVAYMDALRLLDRSQRDSGKMLFVSLGTGTPPSGNPSEASDVARMVDQRTWLGLVKPGTEVVTSGPGELVRQELDRALGPYYIRIQSTVQFGAVHAMDNVQKANRQGLLRTGEALVASIHPILERLAQYLTSP